MKRAALTLLVLTGLATALVLVLLTAALQPEPAVSLRDDISHQDVARVINLLRWHDPRRGAPGRPAVATLSERDIEVLLGHGAQRWLRAASRVSVLRGNAVILVSFHLPRNPFGQWLNVEVQIAETGGLPALSSVRVGRVPVPTPLAEWALQWLAGRVGLSSELRLAADVVQQVRFAPGQVGVRYAWRSDSSARVLAALLPADEQQRLRAYTERLAGLAARERPASDVALVRLLVPMFELARQRTQAGGDAAAENRAALTVLTLFANGRGVDALSPAARSWVRPRRMRVMMGGREDLPLHFLVSATLAAEGSSQLSQAIGLYKEVTDSRGGSGFSFSDMAANRAGTRFGQVLLQDAPRLQVEVARGVQDGDLLPPLADLPDFMPEAEFKHRFGGVESPAYKAMLADIDQSIATLPLLR